MMSLPFTLILGANNTPKNSELFSVGMPPIHTVILSHEGRLSIDVGIVKSFYSLVNVLLSPCVFSFKLI